MAERVRGKPPRIWRFDTDESRQREAYLLLQHLAGMQIQDLAVLLRPFGITPEQYHVLRVLGAAGKDGLACSEVAERSPSGDPDVTRLLDRLESQGWASRSRESADRRVVTARISREGQRLLEQLEEPVTSLHARQFERLGDRDLASLRRIALELAGARVG